MDSMKYRTIGELFQIAKRREWFLALEAGVQRKGLRGLGWRRLVRQHRVKLVEAWKREPFLS